MDAADVKRQVGDFAMKVLIVVRCGTYPNVIHDTASYTIFMAHLLGLENGTIINGLQIIIDKQLRPGEIAAKIVEQR